jgi:hypothetical protein
MEAIGVASATARHEERPDEGTGWYVYVGGEDAGGPFESEDEALEHWEQPIDRTPREGHHKETNDER